MGNHIITFQNADATERVLIWRRTDGNFTYRLQWADASVVEGVNIGWGPAGPDCGIYASADEAETEAMQRVPWLKARFH